MISLKNVKRYYLNGERSVHALDAISNEIAKHEFVSIAGPSGCGKSTLIHLLAGLDTPTSGEICVDGVSLHEANDEKITDYRRRRLGLVFQFFHLLPTMNVLENVSMPLLLQGVPLAQCRARAEEVLDLVGLAPRADHFVHQLSGGEQQRTAIARALVHRPSLLIADEPTGNLDTISASHIVNVFKRIADDKLTTLIVVTHSVEVAQAASRRIKMCDGKIVDDRSRIVSQTA